MDAGVCSACQNPLGQISLEGMLGLFPRVRCGVCGFVNVLSEGAVVAAPPATHRNSETLSLDDNPLYAQPEEPAPFDEEPSEVSATPGYESEVPAFEPDVASGEESPAYEDNADYEPPALVHGAIPDEGEYGQDVPELPIESTRIGIDPSEDNDQ
jgi:hypothetical protein